MNRTRNLALGIGVVLALFIAVLATRGIAGEKAGVSPLLGKVAPDITGVSIRDGSVVKLSDWRGKWVVVNFFSTWCTPCIKEHPEFLKFSTDRAKDVRVLSVVFNDDTEKVKSFFAERGGDWPVIDAPNVAVDFGVAKVPETFIVDPQGVVVAKANGAVTAKSLSQRIDSN